MEQPLRPTWPILNGSSRHAMGLTGWWVPIPGGWMDASHGRRFPGTLTSGASITTAPGSQGGLAGDFDGTDDYVSVADAPALQLATADDWTLAVWCNVETAAGWRGVVTKARDSASLWWGIWQSNLSKWNCTAYTSGVTVTTGVHHVVCRQKGSGTGNEQILFIDGVKDTTNGAATNGTGTGLMRIGQAWTGSAAEAFDGQIWDVRLYRRAMSDAECVSLYSPASRWDLYAIPRSWQRYLPRPAAAGGGGTGARIMTGRATNSLAMGRLLGHHPRCWDEEASVA